MSFRDVTAKDDESEVSVEYSQEMKEIEVEF